MFSHPAVAGWTDTELAVRMEMLKDPPNWDDLQRLDPGVRRLVNPHIYHVSLTGRLRELQQKLVSEALGET